jgi:energy-coupling factor transporter ATP-binding protein EcfA2
MFGAEQAAAALQALNSEIGEGQAGLWGRRQGRFRPPPPQTLAEVGLPNSLLEQLLLKILYFQGDLVGGELSRVMGLRFSFIEPLVEGFKAQQILQIKSSRGFGPVSAVLALTEQGRHLAQAYLENNQYAGPAPVPIDQYCAALQAQRMPKDWLTPERLTRAYQHMVTNEQMLDQIGPAISSGKSLLIYGQPGNGKTHLAEALVNLDNSTIYVPYALECQGNIIQLFDPIYHRRVEEKQCNAETQKDERWAECRRPFIATGGELSLEMLDLSYNTVSRLYDAPFQLKANNGIYLIDDFGRQRATSAEILNRWIVPMERRVDYLSFANGGKMTVPFETFLVFSTNLTPANLGDEAFLRRIQYKVLLRSPDTSEFQTIFRNYCAAQGLETPDGLIEAFIRKHYEATGKQFRRCHPRDVVSQAIDYMNFKRLPFKLTEQLLDRAFMSCFISSADLSDT